MTAALGATTYEEALGQIAAARGEVVVMTAENRAPIRGLPASMGERFIDVGICEQTLIGAAAGLALRGRVPVVHALAAFLVMRAFEFIRTDVGIGRLPVKLVGYVPGFLSEANGPTHQALEDVALMRGIPGMQVFCPADAQDLVEALPEILASPGPAYIRYTALKPVVAHQPFAIGRAEVLSDGPEVAILTYGFLLREAALARELLEARGVPVTLVNLRTLKPIDVSALRKASRCRLVVTVEDHFRIGGLYSILAETFLAERLSARVFPIALEDRWFTPGLLQGVLQKEGFTGHHIAETIQDALLEEAP
jgi:transketolase